jgi:acyl-[acyl carrier protein]--UDP-N-acetylglucosamine O-acyltransferase
MSEPMWHPTAVLDHPPQHREYRRMGLNCWYPPKIHRTVLIEAFVVVEWGTKASTEIGEGTWLMPYVHVGHDAIIGRGCEIAGKSLIGAHAEVGDGAKIGLCATIMPFRKVGAGARIGAGAVVTKDVPAGETWKSPVAAAPHVAKKPSLGYVVELDVDYGPAPFQAHPCT